MRYHSLYKLLVIGATCMACKDQVKITVSNPHFANQYHKNVEISWDSLHKYMPHLTAEKLVISDENNTQLPYQIITSKSCAQINVLVQLSINAGKSTQLTCYTGKPQAFSSRTFGRFVPERKDDFAWENNKVAFRMYGPALEQTGEISNGIDVWAKRTDSLVIDKWYKKNDYHKDNGEGLDFYKVGRTLGAGMMAPLIDSTLVLGNNYTNYEVIENGPLRTTFKLHYAPLKVGDIDVTEVREISLSANSYFNEVKVTYTGNFETLPVAAGIILRGDKGSIIENAKEGFLTYEEPEMGKNGQLFLGLIMGKELTDIGRANGHLIAKLTVKCGEPITYYLGNGWSKAGVNNSEIWQNIVRLEKVNKSQQLDIVYK